MRTIFAATVTAVAVVVLAGIAVAANVYTVGGGSPTRGKPSNAKPIPIALRFDFQVADENPALRGTPIKTFAIGAEGVVTYPGLFPTCTFSQANSPEPRSACRRARVGSGLVQVLVGASSVRTASLFCNVRLTLFNLSGRGKNGGMAIRLDADPPAPTDPDDRTIGCPAAVHSAIKGKFVPVRIGGAKADELRFTVPPPLLHPTSLEATVRNTESRIVRRVSRRTVKVAGKRRRVGFYSAIACKGRKRTIQATFTAEDGAKSVARTQIKRC